jgi:hypothetical protein
VTGQGIFDQDGSGHNKLALTKVRSSDRALIGTVTSPFRLGGRPSERKSVLPL